MRAPWLSSPLTIPAAPVTKILKIGLLCLSPSTVKNGLDQRAHTTANRTTDRATPGIMTGGRNEKERDELAISGLVRLLWC